MAESLVCGLLVLHPARPYCARSVAELRPLDLGHLGARSARFWPAQGRRYAREDRVPYWEKDRAWGTDSR